jgi:hypothetical protein
VIFKTFHECMEGFCFVWDVPAIGSENTGIGLVLHRKRWRTFAFQSLFDIFSDFLTNYYCNLPICDKILY